MAPIFAELRAAITSGDVLVPGNSGYEESLQRWSETCIKPAAVVVRPTTASETSAAVQFARKHFIPFTVRGGGHSPSGTSSSNGGMVIDLSRMRSVSVDTTNQTVTFGGGCIWEDVDSELWKHRLATPGGTVSHTGVGGLILGGGFGMLTGRHGLCIDVLLSCEVVLANGNAVTANKTENADLFWALRGAGQSFGVVISFTSRCFPQGDVWGGLMAWPMSKLSDVVAFMNEFVSKTDGDQFMMPMLVCHPVTGEPCIAASMFFNGDKDEAEKFYGPLIGLKERLMATTDVIPYPTANTFPNLKVPPQKRYMFSGANFVCPLDTKVMQEASDIFHGAIMLPGNEEMKARCMVGFELAPDAKLKSVPTTETAFAGRNNNVFNIVIVISWDNEKKDDEAKEICSRVSGFLKAKGWQGDESGDRGGTYYNYLNPAVDEDRVFVKADRVFGSNIERLRELKLKYDPTNEFKKAVDLMPSLNEKALSN
ncbi:uncharacterized protein BCR38DRAFT_37090 [Pseudomassariella vexata]|uniref:FAD-binding PCMH-type domain-containing protein n=1 Tax=Pseudomassariella vexata TaxID=1141098 RepID=A0A1Y2DR35_9PEZI|nr:uncharacterized protein BCR38DRAFT_37090 [Pseudomassariella vexata]ORY61594.1 hypothetical protein BCR38DRAFT_37090 [Pseudomassariella vexata]